MPLRLARCLARSCATACLGFSLSVAGAMAADVDDAWVAATITPKRIGFHGLFIADTARLHKRRAAGNLHDDGDDHIRTLELGLAGSLNDRWSYRVIANFAHDFVMKDAFLRYERDHWAIMAGQFWANNPVTGTSVIPFTERPSIRRSFMTVRQLGAAFQTWRDHWTLTVGAFDGTINGDKIEDGRVYAARGTAAFPLAGNALLHLGVNWRHRRRDNDENRFQYFGKPYFYFDDGHIDSGAIGARDTLYGFEFAALWNSVSMESECMWLGSPHDLTARRQNYSGCYVTGMWYLTGEKRPYYRGLFRRVAVPEAVLDGGFGAWHLAARYDSIELDGSDYNGGRTRGLTLGLIWEMTNNIRVAANYNRARMIGGIGDGTRVRGLALRFQTHW